MTRPAREEIYGPPVIDGRTTKRRVALGLAVFALLCGSTALATASAPSLPYHTIAHGSGPGSAVTKRAVYVARDVATWRRLWRQLNPGSSPRPPAVDFAQFMVVLVTQGQKPTGGYDITVKTIRRTRGRLVVTVTEQAPGPHCVLPQIVTAPYDAVRVQRTGRPVVVERRAVVKDCRA
jgi:hypothetical protein